MKAAKTHSCCPPIEKYYFASEAKPRRRGDGPRRGRAALRRRRVFDGVAAHREAAGGARAALYAVALMLNCYYLWRKLAFTGNSRGFGGRELWSFCPASTVDRCASGRAG